MKHYVYKLEDKKTKEFYFGSRTCKCKIDEDNYMGSMKLWKPNKDNLVKTIIKDDFETRDEATEYERYLVKKHYSNELNKNYSIPNTGFYAGGEPETNPNYGKTWDETSKQKHSELMKEYYKKNKPGKLGVILSKESKKLISKSRIEQGTAKGSKNPKSYGNVKITDLDNNVQIFDTAKEASIKLKTDRFTLTQHCKNKTSYQRGKYKGWIFEIIK